MVEYLTFTGFLTIKVNGVYQILKNTDIISYDLSTKEFLLHDCPQTIGTKNSASSIRIGDNHPTITLNIEDTHISMMSYRNSENLLPKNKTIILSYNQAHDFAKQSVVLTANNIFDIYVHTIETLIESLSIVPDVSVINDLSGDSDEDHFYMYFEEASDYMLVRTLLLSLKIV